MLTQDRLKELLDYDPGTGIFRWKNQSKATRKGAIAGTLNTKGRRVIQVGGIRYKAHRLAWLYIYGEFPILNIDHKRTLSNVLANLRQATDSQNQWNKGKPKSNTSGYKGVSLQKRKWHARCQVYGVSYNLGRYDTKEEAYDAYCAFASKAHGQFFNPG